MSSAVSCPRRCEAMAEARVIGAQGYLLFMQERSVRGEGEVIHVYKVAAPPPPLGLHVLLLLLLLDQKGPRAFAETNIASVLKFAELVRLLPLSSPASPCPGLWQADPAGPEGAHHSGSCRQRRRGAYPLVLLCVVQLEAKDIEERRKSGNLPFSVVGDLADEAPPAAAAAAAARDPEVAASQPASRPSRAVAAAAAARRRS